MFDGIHGHTAHEAHERAHLGYSGVVGTIALAPGRNVVASARPLVYFRRRRRQPPLFVFLNNADRGGAMIAVNVAQLLRSPVGTSRSYEICDDAPEFASELSLLGP